MIMFEFIVHFLNRFYRFLYYSYISKFYFDKYEKYDLKVFKKYLKVNNRFCKSK